MNWDFLLVFLFLTIASLKANNDDVIKRILQLLKRRYSNYPRTVLRAPRHPEDLPRAEAMLPGHTLIRPSLQMLKSSVKYPKKDLDTAVYGNMGNLGITYGKTPQRIMYTGFRRTGYSILELTIRQAVRNLLLNNINPRTADVIILEATAAGDEPTLASFSQRGYEQSSDNDNDASERLDDSSSEEEKESSIRRSNHHHPRNKYRTRNKLYSSDNSSSSPSDSSSDSSESTDYEKNPGNPFTLHKGKYKQNWMWNHEMDGDHMNINPFGPKYSSAGPSAVGLFFGRKWWYFNQDDYKPLR